MTKIYINPSNRNLIGISGQYYGCVIVPVAYSDGGVVCEIVQKNIVGSAAIKNGDMFLMKSEQLRKDFRSLERHEFKEQRILEPPKKMVIQSVDWCLNLWDSQFADAKANKN